MRTRWWRRKRRRLDAGDGLAAARGWCFGLGAADGSGEADRKLMADRRASELRQLRQLGSEYSGQFRRESGSIRRGDNHRDAGIYVLGGGVSRQRHGMHFPAEYVPGRHGRCGDGVRRPGSNAGAAAELNIFHGFPCLVKPARHEASPLVTYCLDSCGPDYRGQSQPKVPAVSSP